MIAEWFSYRDIADYAEGASIDSLRFIARMLNRRRVTVLLFAITDLAIASWRAHVCFNVIRENTDSSAASFLAITLFSLVARSFITIICAGLVATQISRVTFHIRQMCL